MDDVATKRQLLERAAALLGGRDELARRLGVPSHLLEDWIRGDLTMPDGRLMDLARVLDHFAREERAMKKRGSREP